MSSFVTIVSGLPRSGTSMMMKMLEAGGMTLLTDNLRAADADNPNGYFEFERVKKLPQGDFAWLLEAQGKVVKIIAAFLPYLPGGFEYRIIFMRREIRELLASQRKMLEHHRSGLTGSDEELSRVFDKHLREVDDWLWIQPNISRLNVSYNDLLEDPRLGVERVRFFLHLELDTVKMVEVIDPSLYRQRDRVREALP